MAGLPNLEGGAGFSKNKRSGFFILSGAIVQRREMRIIEIEEIFPQPRKMNKRNNKSRINKSGQKISQRVMEKLKAGAKKEKEVKLVGAGEEQKKIDKPAKKPLKSLERENQLLVQQLVRASSVIRELEDKFYETSRKQTVGKVMVAGLLHDLRNPLAVISSCAQFCMESDDLAPPTKEKLQMIQESVKKANDLAKKFLDYTKTSVLDYIPVDVNRTLLIMWKMCELQSAPCQVTFEAHLEKNLPEIMGSQENLERIFLNLFMNAIHAVSKKGKVIAETRILPPQDMVEIKIIDDGPGISKELRKRIFEPFYTTKEEGTGLGLSICQSLILQHNGSISIDSERDQGTAFFINLPVRQDGPVSASDEATPSE
jgi:signal transduction histidine kinase